MTALYWSKSGPGVYYLRDHPGGRGAIVGKVWSAISQVGGASIYHAMYDSPDAVINFTERGQPKSVMAMLEAKIVARFPAAVFSKEF